MVRRIIITFTVLSSYAFMFIGAFCFCRVTWVFHLWWCSRDSFWKMLTQVKQRINVQLLLLTGKYGRGRNMVETKRPECRERGADGQTWPFFLSSPPGSPKTYLLQLSEWEPTFSLSKNPPSPTL